MVLNRTISVLLVTRLLGRKGEKVRLMSFTGGAHNWELCLRLPPPPHTSSWEFAWELSHLH